MVQCVVERFGRLDIAVNNAGIGILGADEEMAQASWDKVIGVNLTGAFLCAQAEAQQMIGQTPTEGKIINIASMSATIANCNASYDASKAGVVPNDPHAGRRVGGVTTSTSIASAPATYSRPCTPRRPPWCASVSASLRRWATSSDPEDLFGAVIFLASPASNFVTGHDLMVDGGHTLNAWLTPLGRAVPPRVGPEEETVQLKHDLDLLGFPYDDDGINPEVHPEIADAFKAAFGIEEKPE